MTTSIQTRKVLIRGMQHPFVMLVMLTTSVVRNGFARSLALLTAMMTRKQITKCSGNAGLTFSNLIFSVLFRFVRFDFVVKAMVKTAFMPTFRFCVMCRLLMVVCRWSLKWACDSMHRRFMISSV